MFNLIDITETLVKYLACA